MPWSHDARRLLALSFVFCPRVNGKAHVGYTSSDVSNHGLLASTAFLASNVATFTDGEAAIFLSEHGFECCDLPGSTKVAVINLEELPFTSRVMNAIISYLAYLGKTCLACEAGYFYPTQSLIRLTR